MFGYDGEGSGFSFPEQLLLFAVIIHLLKKTPHFDRAARIVRNLVANSENELRDVTIGLNFIGIEKFVQSFQFDHLVHFKTDQIKEEEGKYAYINEFNSAGEHIYQLEDSELFRGCISIFDLDDKFIARKDTFLRLFDEDVIQTDFINLSNTLLCFGDYSQDDGAYTNLLAGRKGIWRSFFTTPAFNKIQLASKAKVVLMSCLDFFAANASTSSQQLIDNTLLAYQNTQKDWKYYFLQYQGFRRNCNKGYYYWDDVSHYPLFKMKEKQFNGYHWDPFLIEIKRKFNADFLELEIGGKMLIQVGNELLQMESDRKGFIIKRKSDSSNANSIFDKLIGDKIITSEGLLEIMQNTDSIDMEDRVVKGIKFIEQILVQ